VDKGAVPPSIALKVSGRVHLHAILAADIENELPYRGSANKFLNVCGPSVQGLAFFLSVLMSLTDADNPTFATGDVVQHRLITGNGGRNFSMPVAAVRLCPMLE
jgi:hypothetical protein